MQSVSVLNTLSQKHFFISILVNLFYIFMLTMNAVCFIQVLEGRPIYVDCYGNLAPLTKAGQQLVLNFYAFKENRLPFCVKVP